jgi:hypothetical protein
MVAVLAMLLPVAPAASAAGLGASLDCGSFAPVDNTCEDEEDIEVEALPDPQPTFNILGFGGHIDLTWSVLRNSQFIGSLTWSCDVFLTASPPTKCAEDPVVSGFQGLSPPGASNNVFTFRLTCRASPLPMEAWTGHPIPQATPPAGFYGCVITF